MGPNKQSECDKLLTQMVQRAAHVTLVKKQRDSLVVVLVNLNRLAAMIGVQAKPAPRSRKIADKLVDNLGDLLHDTQGRLNYGNYVIEMMADLNRLAEITSIWDEPKASPHPQQGTRLAKAKLSYHLKRKGKVLRLVEQPVQSEGRFGFEMSKDDYAAAVSALGKAVGKPTKYELLRERFVNHGEKDSHSNHLLRVALRFWQLSDTPLIKKERAKYSPVAESAKEFRRQAKQAWDDLPIHS